jgi:hypothetical protein
MSIVSKTVMFSFESTIFVNIHNCILLQQTLISAGRGGGQALVY